MSSTPTYPSKEAEAHARADLLPPDWRHAIVERHWLLLLGALALIVPTMVMVAQDSWSTEQGAHGPVVLATGLWLVLRMRKIFTPAIAPGSLAIALPLLLLFLIVYALGRISGTPEIEGYALYAVLIDVAYVYLGMRAMRLIWFPILYFFFLFPPPDSVVAAVTQPLKLGISRAAVALLDAFGFPIARTGVIITVDQYDILVAAACSGLNSIISLSAIGLFYVYMRHNANWRYAMLLMLAIVPVAVLANFVRVLVLILITYYFGDPVAQGFLHGFAGMTMFAIALLGIFGIDMIIAPLRRRLARAGQG
ncbi:exosortase [Sphingomonas vulcanisoli]|uniref:Exosortase n=1 Tax=Sphingomonas vulcanisoli TaxID=1658060 RepID=A0ABX0TUG1_9SPHN|nr:exosortase V [Sphingomonas vulcanisoli]NIJ07804.1 exosortase [Sphingomonas vulcanisoli]